MIFYICHGVWKTVKCQGKFSEKSGNLNLMISCSPGQRHTLKFYAKAFYVMGKALSGELSCMGTGLVLTTPHICEIF